MSLTLTNWIVVIVVGAILIGFGIFISVSVYNNAVKIIAPLIAVLITVGMIFGFNWYNTSTANGVRNYKDWESNINNGIDREIIITAEDGREIFHYEGKVDVESNHEDNYIKFEGEDGKRYIVYYGIQDTITIIEK